VPRGLYGRGDGFLCIGLLAIMISGMLHPNAKTANYVLAYLYVFGAGYLGLKLVLYRYTSVEKLFWVNMAAVLFVAAFSVGDLLLDKLVNVDIQQYIPRVKPARATYNALFRRSYGLATEPTILGFYLNTLGPLALWQLWRLRSIGTAIKGVFTGVVFLGWLFTFSAAALVFMGISLVAVSAVRCMGWVCGRPRRPKQTEGGRPLRRTIQRGARPMVTGGLFTRQSLWRAAGVVLIGGVLLGYAATHFPYIKEIAGPLVAKATLTGTTSVEDRMSRWQAGLESIPMHPVWGIGPGCLSSQGRGSTTNWYLFLTVEAGVAGALPFVLFLAYSCVQILRSQVPGKFWFLTGVIAGGLHFCVVSTVHHPFLWALLAIFAVVRVHEETIRARRAQ